jgi:hypothetical protein
MKRVPRQGRGRLFHISFSGWNLPFWLAALQVTGIGWIGEAPEVSDLRGASAHLM